MIDPLADAPDLRKQFQKADAITLRDYREGGRRAGGGGPIARPGITNDGDLLTPEATTAINRRT